MRMLLVLLWLGGFLCGLAMGFPAGPPNSAVRIPSTGGPPKAGQLDVTANNAVTGLTSERIPFWKSTGGLGDTNSSWSPGTNTLSLSGLITIPTYGIGNVTNRTSGIVTENLFWYIAASAGVCAASPCSFNQFGGFISSVTRSAIGTYTVNLTPGFWVNLQKYCFVTAQRLAIAAPTTCRSGTDMPLNGDSFTFLCERASPNQNVDEGWNIICAGSRTN